MSIYIKVKFLKNNQPTGRAYTYRSTVLVSPGDIVQIDATKKGIVVDEPVDMEWVKTYGTENIREIVGLAENANTAPTGTYDAQAADEAQERYCQETHYPHFAPRSGRCFRCNQNIYLSGKSRFSGRPMPGISVEEAGKKLIIGCPYCNWSYRE